jgi:hypothetical protein
MIEMLAFAVVAIAMAMAPGLILLIWGQADIDPASNQAV